MTQPIGVRPWEAQLLPASIEGNRIRRKRALTSFAALPNLHRVQPVMARAALSPSAEAVADPVQNADHGCVGPPEQAADGFRDKLDVEAFVGLVRRVACKLMFYSFKF